MVGPGGVTRLRRELLWFDTDDGGVEILDPLVEQLYTFTAAEAVELRAIDAGTPPSAELAQRIRAGLLADDATAQVLRDGARHGRRRPFLPPPVFAAGDADDPWQLAADLPGWVAPPWRQPERWRRLAEDHRAGRALLRVEGWLDPAFALELHHRARALAVTRRDTAYVAGSGLELEGELDDVVGAFRDGPVRTLLAHVLGEDLPSRIFSRLWHFTAGDQIAIHQDGRYYAATFSLGLSRAWTARRGGAIAFGTPSPRGLDGVERWLPHLGDLLLFRPSALLWHGVEPVVDGERLTLTGHYVGPDYPG